jgi:nucleotide-binding universal stress UspA family protein
MITIKKILVPTDFSTGSVPAIGYAMLLAKDHDAEVLALHVLLPKVLKENFYDGYIAGGMVASVEAPVPTSHQPDLDSVLESKKQLLRNFLEQRIAHDLLAAIKITPVVRVGKVVNEIVAAAKEEQCDVIVMTSQASGLTRMFRGSFTEQVVRKAPCPVLSMLPSAEVRTLKDERIPIKLIDKWAA